MSTVIRSRSHSAPSAITPLWKAYLAKRGLSESTIVHFNITRAVKVGSIRSIPPSLRCAGKPSIAVHPKYLWLPANRTASASTTAQLLCTTRWAWRMACCGWPPVSLTYGRCGKAASGMRPVCSTRGAEDAAVAGARPRTPRRM